MPFAGALVISMPVMSAEAMSVSVIVTSAGQRSVSWQEAPSVSTKFWCSRDSPGAMSRRRAKRSSCSSIVLSTMVTLTVFSALNTLPSAEKSDGAKVTVILSDS